MNSKALIVVTTLLSTLSLLRNAETVNDGGDKQALDDIDFEEFDSAERLRFWGPHNYPNPEERKDECRVPNDVNEHVCDPDSVFTVDEIRKVAYLIEKVKDYPSLCLCGDDVFECDQLSNSLHIGVALLKYMAFNTTKVVFSKHLSTTWKLGKCGNSLLLLLATEDKEMQLLWGRRGSDLFIRKFRVNVEKKFIRLLASKNPFNAVIETLENIYSDMLENHF